MLFQQHVRDHLAVHRVADVNRHDMADAGQDRDARLGQTALQGGGALLMGVAQFGVRFQMAHRGQSPGGQSGRQAGGEDEAGSPAAHRVHDHRVGGDIAAHDAEGLAQRAFENVDAVQHAVALGDAGAGRAVQAHGVDFVQIGQGAVFLGQGDGARQVGDVAVHRIDALEGDQLGRVDWRGGQQFLKVFKVVVAEDVALAAAVADARDHGGVVQRVREDDQARQNLLQRRQRRLPSGASWPVRLPDPRPSAWCPRCCACPLPRRRCVRSRPASPESHQDGAPCQDSRSSTRPPRPGACRPPADGGPEEIARAPASDRRRHGNGLRCGPDPQSSERRTYSPPPLRGPPPHWHGEESHGSAQRIDPPAQHLDHGGEVLAAVAEAVEQGVEGLGLGAQRRRGAGLGRGVLSQLEVFQHHGGGEAAFIIAVRRGGRHRTGPGVVAGHAPALARRLGGDLEEALGFEPQLLGQGDGLAGADHGDAQQHVVADLGRLTGAVVAGADGDAAHGVQRRFDAGEVGLVAADHEGQRPGVGGRRAARDRRVGEGVTRFLGQGRHLARRLHVDGRAVQKQRAGGRRADDLFGIDAEDVRPGGQHGDDHLGVLHGLGDRGDDELVGLAPDRLVEDVQAVVVGRVGDGRALAVEDEAGGLDLLAKLGALDAVQGLDHGVGGAGRGLVVDDDIEAAGLQRLKDVGVHLGHIHAETGDVEVVIFLAHEDQIQRLIEAHGVQVAVDAADVGIGGDEGVGARVLALGRAVGHEGVDMTALAHDAREQAAEITRAGADAGLYGDGGQLDHLGAVRADDMAADDALGFGLDHQLHQDPLVRAGEGVFHRAEAGDVDVHLARTGVAGLGLGQADDADGRLAEHGCGDGFIVEPLRVVLEHRLMEGHALADGDGGQVHPVGDVADGPDVVGRSLGIFVDLDGAVLVQLDPGGFQPQPLDIGRAAGGEHDHAFRLPRAAAGGDQDLLGRDRLGFSAVLADDLDGVGVLQHGAPMQQVYARLAQIGGVDPGQTGDLDILRLKEGRPVELGVLERPTVALGDLKRVADLGGHDHELLGYAASNDAGAAHTIFLGEGDLLAAQRRQPRRPHPARTGADDKEVVVVLGHRGLRLAGPKKIESNSSESSEIARSNRSADPDLGAQMRGGKARGRPVMIAVLLALALSASAPPAQSAAPAPEDQAVRLEDIQVSGRRLDDLIESFVSEVAAPNRGRGIARWDRSVCVGAVNLRREAAQYLVDRVSTVAEDLGLNAGDPGCTPNLLIVATADGDAFAQELVERRRRALRMGGSGMDRGAAALRDFQETSRPVRWWQVSMPVDSETGQRA
uniref:LigA n=1 Tax=Parastrongyloides trichosuri TaxID=131310 RepID=A0A0N5A4J2_PARTI